MKKTILRSVAIGTICVMSLGQAQCPVEFPPPPFDATGTYEGTWEGDANDGQEAVECPLVLTLIHDVNRPYPGDHAFTGTAVIDYACIDIPEDFDRPEASTVELGFILGDDGSLVGISAGCGVGFCVALGLDGTGEDTDDDGFMDTYAGDWTWSLALAGSEPFNVTGTFSVDAVEVK